jgi:hypothetical protein
MNEVVKFEELSREEQKDLFIQQISGSLYEDEIINLIAIFTNYNINEDSYSKYYGELDNEETINAINNGLQGDDWEEEDNAWNTVIDSLNSAKIFDIIDNVESYMDTYLEIMHNLDDMKNTALKLFAKIL